MKNLFILSVAFFGLISVADAAPITLADKIDPPTYVARTHPVLNVALLDYGQEQSLQQMAEIKNLLEERFYLATNKMIRLNISLVKSMPYRYQLKNYPHYTNGNITDPERLQRLWYYDFINGKILTEVYDVFVKSESRAVVSRLDAIATVTGGQFDGLGFAYGRVGVTESPREIAWGWPDGGRTEIVMKGQIVDELIHEIGHSIFLDHAVSQCQDSALSYKEQIACCEASPNKNDVMSYCRNRGAVNDTDVFFGFEACNLRNIKNKIVPAMLKGLAWNVPDREKCK
jgi:hypothetical protein